MQKLDWIRFTPGTLDEYARRYSAFLDRYAGVETLRYEDFVEDPETQAQHICDVFELQYNAVFRRVFPAMQLSGDSGRGGNDIAPSITPDVVEEIDQSLTFKQLCDRLDYEIPTK